MKLKWNPPTRPLHEIHQRPRGTGEHGQSSDLIECASMPATLQTRLYIRMYSFGEVRDGRCPRMSETDSGKRLTQHKDA